MKILFITYSLPFGDKETFIFPEIRTIAEDLDQDIVVVPMMPEKYLFHEDGKKIANHAIKLPLLSFKIIVCAFWQFIKNPIPVLSIVNDVIRNSNSLRITVNNLVVLPKSVYLSSVINKEKNIFHIHAHWGTTPSTMAYIISKLTNIPWSMTLHRADIYANNMLSTKVKSAKFVRCISNREKNKTVNIAGKIYEKKIFIIHVGVKIDSLSLNDSFVYPQDRLDPQGKIKIVTPANLVQVKGHKYLIDACKILVKSSFANFQCIFYGNGPLRKELADYVNGVNLSDFIKINSAIPHEKLIKMYRDKKIDLVILPSIDTDNGEHEGIPVSLMEAMAHGIPVISTDTGSIPEILSDDAGIIVKQKSPQELADAIVKLISDKKLTNRYTTNGYKKIIFEFDVFKNMTALMKLICK